MATIIALKLNSEIVGAQTGGSNDRGNEELASIDLLSELQSHLTAMRAFFVFEQQNLNSLAATASQSQTETAMSSI